MRPSFLPRLVNGPFEDPGLFIPLFFSNRAIMFDLGDIAALAPRDILKISHVFVTHTHMDHFVGFDRLLRLNLGREKTLCLYGPRGFRKNVEGKLAGYSWNLVENYSNRFALNITEVLSKQLITVQYLCREKFRPTTKATTTPFKDTLYEEPAFKVTAVLLDHSIPCLGFMIEEKFHVNIMKDKVEALGLETGPWLNKFKQALYNQESPELEFVVGLGRQNKPEKKFILGELAEQIAMITPGQKITYIVDVGYTQSNVKRIVEFVRDADYLFIEAAFLEKHKNIARIKNHLTAWQAGSIAGKARVKQFTPFHFSPRYNNQDPLLRHEAVEAYRLAKRQKHLEKRMDQS
jgi:ribonuclease Z